MRDPMIDLRAEVMAQPPEARLDYALDLMAFYLAPVPAYFDATAHLALPASTIRVLWALDTRRGRYVSATALNAARLAGRAVEDWSDEAKVRTAIMHLRRRLARLQVPVTIDTWPEVGYRLTAPEGFRFGHARPAVAA